jgi:hypothetical protein
MTAPHSGNLMTARLGEIISLTRMPAGDRADYRVVAVDQGAQSVTMVSCLPNGNGKFVQVTLENHKTVC